MKITRYVAAHDSGTIINRLPAESQIKGGVVQGIGMAFTEELITDRVTAIPINPNYRDAKVPTHLETPEVEVIFIEHRDPFGPFGGKVVGEPPITPLWRPSPTRSSTPLGNESKNYPSHRTKSCRPPGLMEEEGHEKF